MRIPELWQDAKPMRAVASDYFTSGQVFIPAATNEPLPVVPPAPNGTRRLLRLHTSGAQVVFFTKDPRGVPAQTSFGGTTTFINGFRWNLSNGIGILIRSGCGIWALDTGANCVVSWFAEWYYPVPRLALPLQVAP